MKPDKSETSAKSNSSIIICVAVVVVLLLIIVGNQNASFSAKSQGGVVTVAKATPDGRRSVVVMTQSLGGEGKKAPRLTLPPKPTPAPTPQPTERGEVIIVKRTRNDISNRKHQPHDLAHEAKQMCPFAYTVWEQAVPPRVSKEMQKLTPIAPLYPRVHGNLGGKKIPFTVMVTHHEDYIPEVLHRNIMHTLKRNPAMELNYFSDRLARAFLVAHAHFSVVRAFDKAKPGPYKADIFKYQYLYLKGGWYTDASLLMGEEMDLFEVHRYADEFVGTENNGVLHGGLIGVLAKHPLMSQVLQTAVDNVLNERYGSGPAHVTGDGVLTAEYLKLTGKGIQPGVFNDHTIFPIMKENSCASGKILAHGRVLAYTVFPEYASQMTWFTAETSDVVSLWRSRSAFYATGSELITEDAHGGCFGGEAKEVHWNLNRSVIAERLVLDMLPHHNNPRSEDRGDDDIPTTIVQMFIDDEIPKRMRDWMDRMMYENPTFNHQYFSHERARSFIEQQCGEKVLQAFDMLEGGAFKSDIFRYCYLNVSGGVYIDADFTTIASVLPQLSNTRLVLAFDDEQQLVTPGFIAVTKGNPFMQKVLDRAVENVLEHENKSFASFQDVTGAAVITSVFLEELKKIGPLAAPKSLTTYDMRSRYSEAAGGMKKSAALRTLRWRRSATCATGAIDALNDPEGPITKTPVSGNETSPPSIMDAEHLVVVSTLFLTQYKGYNDDLPWYFLRHSELVKVQVAMKENIEVSEVPTSPLSKLYTPAMVFEAEKVFKKK